MKIVSKEVHEPPLTMVTLHLDDEHLEMAVLSIGMASVRGIGKDIFSCRSTAATIKGDVVEMDDEELLAVAEKCKAEYVDFMEKMQLGILALINKESE